MSTGVDGAAAVRSDLDELRTSARGWHGVQLAVLGFIGLCGALQSGSASTAPQWLQQLAGILVLLALAVACAATVLVAGAAWPVGWRAAAAADATSEAEVRRGGRHVRTGIVLTFVAVGLVALATSSSWWPNDPGSGQLVEVSTAQGTLCGTLVDSDEGGLALEVGGQRVVLGLDQVAGVRPVDSC